MGQLRAGGLRVLRALEPATSEPQLDRGVSDLGARAGREVGDHRHVHVGQAADAAGAGGGHLDLGHRCLLGDHGCSIGGFLD